MRQCMVVAIWVQKAAGGLRRFEPGPAGAAARRFGNNRRRRIILMNCILFTVSIICWHPIAQLSLERYRLQKRLSMFRTA
jgi:hypothetical protein